MHHVFLNWYGIFYFDNVVNKMGHSLLVAMVVSSHLLKLSGSAITKTYNSKTTLYCK